LVLNNESWLTNGVWGFQQIPSPLYKTIHGASSAYLHSHPNLPIWIHDLIAKSYDWFYLALVLVVLFILYLIMERLVHSPWGRVIRAIREDEDATAMLGKNTFSFKIQALVLGAMIMGIGGSMYAHYARFISPISFKPLYGTFIIWVMLILGGSGNNKGAILGSFAVWGIWAGTDFLTKYLPFSATQSASLRVILIAVLLDTATATSYLGCSLSEMSQQRLREATEAFPCLFATALLKLRPRHAFRSVAACLQRSDTANGTTLSTK